MGFCKRTGYECIGYQCQDLSDYTDAMRDSSVPEVVLLDAIVGVISQCEQRDGHYTSCAAQESVASLSLANEICVNEEISNA